MTQGYDVTFRVHVHADDADAAIRLARERIDDAFDVDIENVSSRDEGCAQADPEIGR